MTKKKTALQSAQWRIGGIIGIIALVVFVRAMIILPHEQEKYDKHASAYLEKHNARKEGLERRVSKQERFHVIKHLWLSGKEPRLEVELKAVRSEVGATVVKAETRLIETFHDTEGMVQEELFYKDTEGHEYTLSDKGEVVKKNKPPALLPLAEKLPEEAAAPVAEKGLPALADLIPMQRFRYFEADSAIYDYHSNALIASKVDFWTYIAPGHELVKNRDGLWPDSSGSAGTMTLSHLGTVGSLQFSAENLNMEMAPQW